MAGTEQWKALQASLIAARQHADSGDTAGALEALNAALAIDPENSAAHALRDRILGEPRPLSPLRQPSELPSEATPPPGAVAAPREIVPQPLVSSEGYARFEQRAKRRRIERRIDAARTAIARRQLTEARAAIAEIRELDPDCHELTSLVAALQAARRARITGSLKRVLRGPAVTAAAVFFAIVLGASWLERSDVVLTPPRAIVSALNALRPPIPVVSTTTSDEVVPVATTGSPNSTVAPAPVASANMATPQKDELPARDPFVPLIPSPPAAQLFPAPAISTPSPANMVDNPVPAAIVELTEEPSPAAVMPPPAARKDEEALVQQVLQRYRSAYDGLDAQSARDVWPAVNQAALARAFDGLESQNLTFDACNVELRGEVATATCRGSARYVPKVGSRSPRTEPRVWNFTLHKLGSDWKIDTARAER